MQRLSSRLRSVARPLLLLLNRQRLHTARAGLFQPDRVDTNAQSYISWDPSVPAKLRTDDNDQRKDIPFRLVQTFFKESAKNHWNAKAVAVKRGGQWVHWTYEEYHAAIRSTAKGFLALGLGRRRGVGIMGMFTPEMLFATFGAIFAGGLSCGVYPTNSGDTVSYLSNKVPFDLLLVEDEETLERALDGRTAASAFPTVKKLVVMDPDFDATKHHLSGDVIGWNDLQSAGKSISDAALADIEADQCVNEACLTVFTSGTTGMPKGVLLSHDNLAYEVTCYANYQGWQQEAGVAYLPLCHVGPLLAGALGLVACAGTCYCADKNAVRTVHDTIYLFICPILVHYKGTLVDTLREAPSTWFFGVPRVWEKFAERVGAVEAEAGFLKRSLIRWARAKTEEHTNRVIAAAGKSTEVKESLSYRLAQRLVIGKIQQTLGLSGGPEHLGKSYSAGAPLTPEAVTYLKSLGYVVLDNYGSSESTGIVTGNTKESLELGTAGAPVPGVSVKINNPSPDGEGEIIFRGRNTFLGYLWDEQKTKETFTEDFWCRTGDIGRLTTKGNLQVVGRLKEILITSGGENIAPVLIENNIKAELTEVVSNAMVIGDNRKYLTVLVTLRVEPDPVTAQPTNILTKEVVQWCSKLGIDGLRTVEDFRSHDDKSTLLKAIQSGITRANSMALANPHKMQDFRILPEEFSLAGGELGPTLKLKRHFVVQKYADVIEEMYSSE